MTELENSRWKIVVLLLWILPLGGIAQSYFNSTTVWKEYRYTYGSGIPFEFEYDHLLVVSGDTVINGDPFFKIQKQGWDRTYESGGDVLVNEEWIDEEVHPIAILNDTLFMHHLVNDTRIPIARFNMEVGDTSVNDPFCMSPQVVTFIDTVNVGDIAHRQFHFENNELNVLIEGVGSSKGLYERPCNALAIEGEPILQCFFQDGEYLEVNPGGDCANYVGLNEFSVQESVIRVSPNPFSSDLRIALHLKPTSESMIDVYDLQGRVILSKKVFPGEQSVQLELSEQLPGMYVIKWKGSGKARTVLAVKY